MREVVLNITCDKCEKPIDEDYAISLEIKVSPGGGLWEMDLHEHCTDQILATARMLKPERKTNSGQFPCGTCEFIAKTEGGLRLHNNRKHGEETTETTP